MSEQPEIPWAGALAALSGAGVMVAEVGVVRLAAPTLGGSQPVWATVIAAVLLGVALGNGLGGRRARSEGRSRAAGWLLVAGGLGVACLPFVLPPLLGASGVVLGMVCLAVCSGLPVVPLGALTPLLIRAGSRDLAGVGPAAGKIQALATAGALVGTLGSAFLLTPWLGSARTFLVSGALLLLPGVWLTARGGVGRSSGVLLAVALPFLPAPVPEARAGETRLAWVETPYAVWEVAQENHTGIRWLRTDEGSTAQSYVDPSGELQVGSWPLLVAAPFLAERAPGAGPRTLHLIGAGGGTVARELLGVEPDARVSGSELDGAALALGRTWFGLPARARIEVGDGRRLLARSGERFDAIVVDAYRSAYVPPHLVTREFFELVRSRLQPGGVLALNLLSARRWLGEAQAADDGPLVGACARTAAAVFPEVRLLDAGNGLNTILYASARAIDPARALRALKAVRERRPSLVRHLEQWLPKLRPAAVGPGEVLSDDRAPVAWLTHRLALRRLFGGRR